MEEKTFVLCKCGKWIPKQCYNHHLQTKKHKRYIWEMNCHAADVTIPPYIEEITRGHGAHDNLHSPDYP